VWVLIVLLRSGCRERRFDARPVSLPADEVLAAEADCHDEASRRDEKGDDSDKQIVEVLGVGVGLGRGGH